MRRVGHWAAWVCLIIGGTVRGGGLAFETDVRPVLKEHCFQCHGERGKKEGGLDLRLVRFMDHEVDAGGRTLVPGDPGKSALIEMVKSGEMPKAEKKLTAAQISVLEKWVAEGAKTARPEPESIPDFYISEEERQFWAFLPIQSPPVPAVKDAELAANPIDAFVVAKAAEKGLTLAPKADRATLLRRASFDLLGLPPSPEEIRAFENDAAPDAWERAVDRLLASPAYGERWGRHWLDVAGYADTNGAVEADSVRPQAWRYRDYVIKSFNADKPWDRFIQEQLAGDELAGVSHSDTKAVIENPEALEKFTATGFLRMAPDGTADNPPDAKLARNQVMADTLRIVGSSLLGMTVHCAQCHDHRYDPISHEDYHRLRAIFEPVFDWKQWRGPRERLYSLYTEADKAKAAEIEAKAQKMDAERLEWAKGILDAIFEKRVNAAPPELQPLARAARNTPAAKRTPEQVQFLKDHIDLNVGTDIGLLNVFDGAAEKEGFKKRDEANAVRATKPPEGFVMAATEVAGAVPDTFLFNRGDFDQPKQKVSPSEMTILARKGGETLAKVESGLKTTGRRLAYARWLTGGEHPLVARVLVNRFWQHHFGRGLVNTPGDFGHLGERPTHPELLDWLASDFQSHGWQLKRLHRMILTSRTWQQSSHNPTSETTDAENKWLARWRLQRLDAETVRDCMLSVSGTLNKVPFGPPVAVARHGSGRIVTGEEMLNPNSEPVGVKSLGEEENRRSVYVQQRRMRPLTVLDTFDLPVMSPNCDARSVTTVALQSLMMMNDTFVLDQAEKLAARTAKEAPEGPTHRIERLWQLVYGQKPSATETAAALVFLRENASLGADKPFAALCQIVLASNRFLYIE